MYTGGRWIEIWILKLKTWMYAHNNAELQILNCKLLNPKV